MQTDQNLSNPDPQQSAPQANDAYDIIIVGAGSAGALLANRLTTSSKFPHLSILILEAGIDRCDDPEIRTPAKSGSLLNNPKYDWRFVSEPELNLGGRRIKHPRGKVVGGTGAINSHSLVFPNRGYHDFWNNKLLRGPNPAAVTETDGLARDRFSNTSGKKVGKQQSKVDWSWEGIARYYRRFLNIQPADANVQKDLKVRYQPQDTQTSPVSALDSIPASTIDGGADSREQTTLTNGFYSQQEFKGIQASFPRTVQDLPKLWVDTFKAADFLSESIGIDGQAFGGVTTLNAVDARPHIGGRSHTGREFWHTLEQSYNVTTITNASVEKIIFSEEKRDSDDKLLAIGIQLRQGGEIKTVKIKDSGEIILCAGVFGSPQILELSGIGIKHSLAAAGISCIYELPGVGENLQDHLNCGCSVELKEGVKSRDLEAQNEALLRDLLLQFESDRTGPLAEGWVYSFSYLPTQFLSSEAEQERLLKTMDEAIDRSNKSNISEGLKLQHEFIREMTQQPKEATSTTFMVQRQRNPDLDVLPSHEPRVVPGNYITLVSMLSHPFSRGSCHVVSDDISIRPRLIFNYLEHPSDRSLLLSHLTQIDRLLELSPLSDKVKANGRRLPRSFPRKFSDASERELDQMLASTTATNYHPCGTCAMMREELGGVVDENLMVYGTKNVRVVDASILPIVPRGNILTTVYAVAEKAADIIIDAYSTSDSS